MIDKELVSAGDLLGGDEDARLVQHCDVTKLVHVEMLLNLVDCTGRVEELHKLYVGRLDEGV